MPRSSPSWFLSSSRNFHSTTPGFCWRAETASARSRWRHTWEASVKNGTIKQHVIRQSCLSKRVNVSRSRLAARQRTRASPGVTWALTSLRVGILGVEEIDKSVVELPAIRARALVAAGRCKSNTTTVITHSAGALTTTIVRILVLHVMWDKKGRQTDIFTRKRELLWTKIRVPRFILPGLSSSEIYQQQYSSNTSSLIVTCKKFLWRHNWCHGVDEKIVNKKKNEKALLKQFFRPYGSANFYQTTIFFKSSQFA